MTGSEYDKAKKEWLQQAEESIGRKFSALERKLLERIIDVITENIKTDKGRITEFDSQIYNRIARVFSKFDEDSIPQIIKEVSTEIGRAIEINRSYLSAQEAARFEQIADSARKKALRSIGITQNATTVAVSPSSPLALLLSSSDVRSRVVKVVMNAVNGGASYSDTLKGVREILSSGRSKESTFLRYYKTTVFDIMLRTDRLHNSELAGNIGLDAFIYSGTVIEKTRSFCKSKAGKVFLRSEAQEWKRQDWPGKNDGYDPLRDLGGYNCRHQVRWISNTEAIRRRDDLRIVNGKLQVI